MGADPGPAIERAGDLAGEPDGFDRLWTPHRMAYIGGENKPADAAAWSLAVFLLITGTAHFAGGLRDDMIRMVPPAFPRPALLVTITGVCELLGAAGLVFRRTRPPAGIALAILFVAVLPANIYATHNGLTLGGHNMPPLALRIPEQVLYIGLALAPLFGRRQENRI